VVMRQFFILTKRWAAAAGTRLLHWSEQILIKFRFWAAKEIFQPLRSDRRQLFFLILQLASAAVAGYWISSRNRTPHPGIAVAWIALVAAAMSIHPDMSGWQKAVWMLAIGAFLIVETRAIAKDREETNRSVAADRAAQNENFNQVRVTQLQTFNETAESLKRAIAQSQDQFQRTMAKSDQIVGEAASIARLSQQSIDAVTGGKSYAVVWPSEIINDEVSFNVIHKGDYAVRGLTLNLSNRATTDQVVNRAFPPPTLRDVMSTYTAETVGDLPGVVFPLRTKFNLLGLTRADYKIMFIALNGTWTEDLQLRKVGNVWAWASRTFRFNPETKKLDTLETDVRPEYPLERGEVDWYDPPDPR
jgi:uncharacterized membrane-anchored protein YhcB (DUF1043 family)